VTIPTCISWNVITLHGFESGKNIFENSCLNVVRSRFTVCSWGTFIKDPTIIFISLVKGFMKNLLGLPHVQYFAFHLRKVDAIGYLAIHVLDTFLTFNKREIRKKWALVV
jgi:hypothetical protein